MTSITTPSSLALVPSLETAWQDVDSSFERFCLTAGIGAIEQMLCEDAQQLAGAPHSRGGGRVGHRWGRTKGKIGFHGGKVAVHRPRVRSLEGQEFVLPSWAAAQDEDWLGHWAMNQMLINVSTRKFRRSVRLPGGDVPVIAGDGTSKSAASRRFVALSANAAEWLATDLSKLDLLAIQIDGLHISDELILVAALGIDGRGEKHPLGLVEGATENAATVQALLDNLVERGLDPKGLRCSSSTAPRPCPRRSAGPSAKTRRSSAVRCTRRATSPNGCPSRCTPRCARPCGRPGNTTMPSRPSGWCGTWHDGWRRTGPASRPPSWKGWKKSCAWSGSACPRIYGALWPVPTSSRT